MTHVKVTVLESAPLHHRQQHCITDVELRRVAMQRRSMRAALNCGVKSTTVSVHQGKAVGDGVAELNIAARRAYFHVLRLVQQMGNNDSSEEHTARWCTSRFDVADVAMTTDGCSSHPVSGGKSNHYRPHHRNVRGPPLPRRGLSP